jgi:hypothetical protein
MDRRPATSRRDRRAAATRLSGNALRRAGSTSVRSADQVALKTMTGHPHHGLLVARDIVLSMRSNLPDLESEVNKLKDLAYPWVGQDPMHCGGLGTNPERCGETRRGAVSDLSTTVFGGVEPKVGIEPTTYALPRRCSTSELLGPGHRTGRWYPMATDSEAPDPPEERKDISVNASRVQRK